MDVGSQSLLRGNRLGSCSPTDHASNAGARWPHISTDAGANKTADFDADSDSIFRTNNLSINKADDKANTAAVYIAYVDTHVAAITCSNHTSNHSANEKANCGAIRLAYMATYVAAISCSNHKSNNRTNKTANIPPVYLAHGDAYVGAISHSNHKSDDGANETANIIAVYIAYVGTHVAAIQYAHIFAYFRAVSCTNNASNMATHTVSNCASDAHAYTVSDLITDDSTHDVTHNVTNDAPDSDSHNVANDAPDPASNNPAVRHANADPDHRSDHNLARLPDTGRRFTRCMAGGCPEFLGTVRRCSGSATVAHNQFGFERVDRVAARELVAGVEVHLGDDS